MPSRARPPSPELTNLDCAFPPFPTKVSRSNTPVSDARSQNSDNESSYVRAHAEPYNVTSRRGTTSSSGTRKRSKTLGGNHDTTQMPSTTGRGRRPSLANVTAGAKPGFKNAPPLPSPLNCVASGETQNSKLGNEVTPSLASQPINPSSQSKDLFQSPSSPPKSGKLGEGSAHVQQGSQRVPNGNISEGKEVKIPTFEDDTRKRSDMIKLAHESSETPREMGVPSYRTRRPPPIANTWLRQPENGSKASFEKPQGSPSRSQTFPLTTGTNEVVEDINKAAQRRPSEPSVTSQSSWPLGPVAAVPPEKPPSQTPLSSTISFSGRSYHSPSESASSYGSVNSVEQSASSRSSQPLQDVEPEKVPDSASMYGQPEVQEPEILTPPKPSLLNYDTDSPTDPAFRNGRLTPLEPPELHRTQTTPEPPAQTSVSLADDSEQDLKRRPFLRSKTTGGNKGQCRGCSKIIAANQKSVSSADGRLTGRYHKECFACTTCHAAFATADFYVLKDQPYCAQHYHALNGSLCGSCGRGIEGQYLEATRSEVKGPEKFHAKCFTCVMCRVVLEHDYFAHHGRFFCERDIHRVASPPNRSPNGRGPANGAGPAGNSYLSVGNGMPRGKFPERRSTKLMIML
jgi:hypothetical protein